MARRMVLVPESEATPPPPPAAVDSFEAIDADIAGILNNKKIDEYEKWHQYSTILEKYLTKYKAFKNKNSAPIPESFEEETNDNFNVVKNLLKRSASIEWDKNGVVVVDGEKTNGNIDSLIEYLVTDNEEVEQPQDWPFFFKSVKNMQIPTDYAPRLRRKQQQRKQRIKNVSRKKRGYEASDEDDDQHDDKRFKKITAEKRKSIEQLEFNSKFPKITPSGGVKRSSVNDTAVSKKVKTQHAGPKKRKRSASPVRPRKRFKSGRIEKRRIVAEKTHGGKRRKIETNGAQGKKLTWIEL